MLTCHQTVRPHAQLTGKDDLQAQQQSGGSDCGLFAIANAIELCFGLQPSHAVYDQSSMREHLINCFSHHKLLPFPKQNVETKPALLSTTEVKVYSICM